ncbi:hypothetical protein Pint_18624 [Pistacia integerrima]|uniref:Uncharacterized protein n=1 Tax=Pistacia integerrima TaxID=434235 RepID=A0ACC0Z1G8_9ROSI|nr:hypothetical protein Pint_18624 [Pistacia integerrima]
MALAFKGNVTGDLSSPGPNYLFDDKGDGSDKKNIAISNNSSSPSSGTSNGFAFQAETYQPDESHSLINFKSGYDNFMHANASSLLSFEQSERSSMWEGNLNHNTTNQWNPMNPKYSTSNPRLMEDFNCFDTASNYGDWLYTDATTVTDCILESGSSQDATTFKRPHMGESTQALKKQCTSATSKKPNKAKSITSKDPQSIAAKNRRERISERLKTLQELVPNGSKVDLVTMLEKAISYVKFLQLQVKVLATDEFWPVQGGKAPDISQVKEAIDAILSSQRDKKSSSKQ